MARYGVVVLSIVMMVATAILAGACGTQPGGGQQVGEMQSESKSIQPQNAQAVGADLKMGAGELNITGGADPLMEGEFSYNVSEWKPKLSYDVSGDEGELIVKQGVPTRAPASVVMHATSGTSASTTKCPPISWCRWARERVIWIWTALP
jgi:hypothetical protein